MFIKNRGRMPTYLRKRRSTLVGTYQGVELGLRGYGRSRAGESSDSLCVSPMEEQLDGREAMVF